MSFDVSSSNCLPFRTRGAQLASSNSSPASSSAHKAELLKRKAVMQPAEENKEASPRRIVVKAGPADAVPFIPRRTRKSFVSSIVRIGRNFQKPIAAAKQAQQAAIHNQCDAVFKGAVKLSGQTFNGYVNEMNTFGMPRHLALCEISKRIGKGIFLKPDAEALPENTFIGIYAGELQLIHQKDPERSSYAFTVLSDLELAPWERDAVEGGDVFGTNRFCLEVEASRSGNFTRYLNHAGAEDANVRHRYILMEDGTIQIGLWTKKAVAPGEQLMLDYEIDFWITQAVFPEAVNPRTHRLYPDGSVS